MVVNSLIPVFWRSLEYPEGSGAANAISGSWFLPGPSHTAPNLLPVSIPANSWHDFKEVFIKSSGLSCHCFLLEEY